ncbi:hypothetical protein D3C85_1287070 [compost metagenome]
MSKYTEWPIPSIHIPIGRAASLSNGNFIFGNSKALIYVNKADGSRLDITEVGGTINSISIVNEKIYISAGNALLVAEIQNGKIKIIARTHFDTTFGGSFNVISSRVAGNYVFVACGNKGTYVFNLVPKN